MRKNISSRLEWLEIKSSCGSLSSAEKEELETLKAKEILKKLSLKDVSLKLN